LSFLRRAIKKWLLQLCTIPHPLLTYLITTPARCYCYHLYIRGHDILKSISELYYCAVAYFEMHSICGKGITDIYLLSSTKDHGRHSAPISVHTWNVGVFKIEQWFGKSIWVIFGDYKI